MDIEDYEYSSGSYMNMRITNIGRRERAETIKAYVETLAMMKKDFNLPVDNEVSKLFDIIKGDVNYMVNTKADTNFKG